MKKAIRLIVIVLVVCLAFVACGKRQPATGNGDDPPIENTKPIAGVAYYVDPESGSDSNDGLSTTKAWKTLDRVVAHGEFKAGETIALKGGYTFPRLEFSGSGTAGSPITVTSYGEGKATIDGEGYSFALRLFDQSHITLENLKVTNAIDDYGTAQLLSRDGIYIGTSGGGVYGGYTIRGCEVKDVHGSNIRNNFLDNAAINIRYGSAANEDNRFENILIENCSVVDSYGIGIRIGDSLQSADPARANPSFTNVVIKNTDVIRTGGDGVILQTCVSPLVEGCRVLYAGANSCYVLSGGTDDRSVCIAGLWSCATSDPVFRGNEVGYTYAVPADGQAFDMDWGTRGTAVWEYNYTHDNEGGILLRHANYSGVYRYNISVNDGNGKYRGHDYSLVATSYLTTYSQETCHYYNNLFYNDQRVMRISTGYANNSSGEFDSSTWIDVDNTFNRFSNNIFCFLFSESNIINWLDQIIYENNAYVCINDGSKSDTLRCLRDVGGVYGTMEDMCFYNATIDASKISGVTGAYEMFRIYDGCELITDRGLNIENNGGYDYNGMPLRLDAVNIGPFDMLYTG